MGGRRCVLLGCVVLACTSDSTPPQSGSSTTDAPTSTSTGSSTTTAGKGSSTAQPPDFGSGDPMPSQSMACQRFLECATDAEADNVGELEMLYGPDGSCWAGTLDEAAACSSDCGDQRAALRMMLEADGVEVPLSCEDPREVAWGPIEDRIFETCVTGCHEPGGSYSLLDLSEDPHGALVFVGSSSAPILIVQPGDHETSYLWHLLRGTGGSVGGDAGRMPAGGAAPWTDEEIEDVAVWIDDGAPTF